MSENRVVDVILHCQKQFKKDQLPDEKLLHYLGRLSRLRITVQDLAETGIGRTVNQLSRNEGQVGQAADTLVRGWKRMVSEQQIQAENESEESDSNSNSGSSDDEDDEDEDAHNDAHKERPREINESVENPAPIQQSQEEYRNGHNGATGTDQRRDISDPTPNPRSFEEEHDDEDDMVDDIDDSFMGNDLLDMANVHTDEDEDDEDDDDDDDSNSDSSDRLQIADGGSLRNSERAMPENIYIKQEKQEISQGHSSDENRDHRSSHSKSSSHRRSQENGEKKPTPSSSSKSSDHYQGRTEVKSSSHSSSSSSKDTSRSHHSSKSHYRGDSKERSSKYGEQISSADHRSHHSSKERSKDKSDSSSPEKSQLKEKDRHRRSDKYSKDGSSHRDKEREREKQEKERSKDRKDSSDHYRSSSQHSHKDKTRETSSSQAFKKSSPEIKKSDTQEDRKRRENSESSGASSSKKQKLVLKEEIDSTSGINFADVLGCLDTSSSKLKKVKKEEVEKPHRKHESHSSSQPHKSESGNKKQDGSSSKHRDGSSSSSSSSKRYDKDSEVTKLIKKPAHSKIESVIKPVVNISPNYKPTSSSVPSLPRPSSSNGLAGPILSHTDLSDLGTVDYWNNTNGRCATAYSVQQDDISSMLSSRNARSKVYSGAKTARRGDVPSLFDLCMQVIKNNIGDLGYTGGIPYDILKPALEQANPMQLINIESQNEHLVGETDELWQFHCKRDFKGRCPEDMESWRELYERCADEQKSKFDRVKKKLNKSINSAEPQRKALLAYVDPSGGGPRFNKSKAQTIKNGMKSLKMKEEKGAKRGGASSSASAGFNNPKNSSDNTLQEAAVVIGSESRAGHAPAPPVSRESTAAKFKPRKAPLMQKTMKLIRSLNRR